MGTLVKCFHLNQINKGMLQMEMDKYKCTVCGYIYRPERGDKLRDIPPNTPFDELPEDWKCPTCNQPKMVFVEMEK